MKEKMKGDKMKLALHAIGVIFFAVQLIIAQEHHPVLQPQSVQHAVAIITPTKGNMLTGIVTFEETEKGVRIIANLSGLSPGSHGFHIHEFGDLRSDDGTSAGGHYNPTGMPHSMPMTENRHAGDMGNITADSSGNSHLDYVDPVMQLQGLHSIIGRAVIVHAKEDDLKTQPTGNAGARIGQGVIGVAKWIENVNK
jgi:Cu-Zn family superoxide dismutase